VKKTITAVALVGFYRGEPLIEAGTILELSPMEFAELRAFNQVDYAPDEVPPPQTPISESTAPGLVQAKAKK
jgi:hypothetical protein